MDLYNICLSELKELRSKIFSESDIDKQNLLIEDYNRLHCHLLAFSKEEIVNDSLERLSSDSFKDVTNKERMKYYNNFINLAPNFIDINHNLLLLLNNNSSVIKFNSDFNKYSNDCFNELVNINSINLKAFNDIKNRLVISKDYNYKSFLSGHSVCFKSDIKPSIFVYDTSKDLINNRVLSHELGHVIDFNIRDYNTLSNNSDFLIECYSLFMEMVYSDMLNKYDNEASKYLINVMKNNYTRTTLIQELVRFYVSKTGELLLDTDGNILLDLDKVDDASKNKINGISKLGLPSVNLYNYIIGICLAITFINDFNGDYKNMFLEFNDFINKASISDVFNYINFDSINKYLGKKR